MQTLYLLPGAGETLIAQWSRIWGCSLAEAEERLVRLALESVADPGVESDGNIVQLPVEAN